MSKGTKIFSDSLPNLITFAEAKGHLTLSKRNKVKIHSNEEDIN